MKSINARRFTIIRCALQTCHSVPGMVYPTYMMASASAVLYIGVTNHLERRVAEHQSKRAQGFTYNTTKLIYFESFSDIRNAIAREKQWKTWCRDKKIALIKRLNPQWRELSEDFN